MAEVGFYQLFFYLARNLVVLSLAYHMYANLNYELWQICAYFTVGQIFWFICSPVVGPIIKWTGVKHGIAIRAFGLALFWFLLPFVLTDNFYETILWVWPLFLIRGLGGATSLVAYDIFLAHHLNKKSRGQSLAYLQVAIMAATVVAPILGGYITDKFGFEYTTYIGLFFFLLAGFVLLLTPDEKFNFPYTPQKLVSDFKTQMPKPLIEAEFGRVFFDGVMYLAWPIFLVIVMTNMISIGLVAGLSSGVAMVVALWMGKRIDKGAAKPDKALRHGAYRSVVLNFVRGVWWEPFTIGIIDSLNKVNDQTMKVPYDLQFYKWINAENTLERAHLRILLDQGIYLFNFAIITALLYFFTNPQVVFIVIFVLAALSLWFTQRISEVGRAAIQYEAETQTVLESDKR